MSIYTVNGNPVKYDNKWLANGGTPSSELPPYDSSDAGKALVVNNDGDNVEWQTVSPSVTVDQHYDSSSLNAQSGTAVAEALETKQDIVSDLSEIRSGAESGATAVQPSALATVATTGDYGDLLHKPTIPTVNNGTLTINQGTSTLGTFTANQSGNTTVTISDAPALPKRYFYVEQDSAVTHSSANSYYSLRYTWPSGIDTSKDYIVQFMINIDKPKSELTQLNNADLPFEVSVETVGAFHFADAAGVMTCLDGSFANYYGSASILVRVPSTYFSNGNGLNFLTYFPHVLTAADTFSFKITGYFVEEP